MLKIKKNKTNHNPIHPGLKCDIHDFLTELDPYLLSLPPIAVIWGNQVDTLNPYPSILAK